MFGFISSSAHNTLAYLQPYIMENTEYVYVVIHALRVNLS